MRKNIIIALIVVVLVALGFLATSGDDRLVQAYNPHIEPQNFSTNISNPYFSLPVGKKMIFRAMTEDGLERTEIQILGDMKEIMGVATLTYWDRVWLDDRLMEDTKDYLAQDAEGNVWYFGEIVDNYENGLLVDHDGSWIAGKDGALPGIWFPAEPRVGMSYRQEFYPGEAEDMANVVAIAETVHIGIATYHNCVKIYEWTPLEPDAKEHKFYCQDVGGLVAVDDLESGLRAELVND